jgi:hypothetical protein
LFRPLWKIWLAFLVAYRGPKTSSLCVTIKTLAREHEKYPLVFSTSLSKEIWQLICMQKYRPKRDFFFFFFFFWWH